MHDRTAAGAPDSLPHQITTGLRRGVGTLAYFESGGSLSVLLSILMKATSTTKGNDYSGI
jgi:hypothetical protein